VERDPNKRRVKPPANPELVCLDDIDGESSSDSDFRIEDHYVNSESDSDGASYFTYTDGEYIILFLIYLNQTRNFFQYTLT
jgi:hypothetical protein